MSELNDECKSFVDFEDAVCDAIVESKLLAKHLMSQFERDNGDILKGSMAGTFCLGSWRRLENESYEAQYEKNGDWFPVKLVSTNDFNEIIMNMV